MWAYVYVPFSTVCILCRSGFTDSALPTRPLLDARKVHGKHGYLHEIALEVKHKFLCYWVVGVEKNPSSFAVSTSMKISSSVLGEEYTNMCIH